MRTEAVAPDFLDAYRRAARASFLAKADVAVLDETLAQLPASKTEFAAAAAGELARLAARILGRTPAAVEFLPGQGTFHAVFRIEAGAEVLFARTSVPAIPRPALDFLVDAWAAERLAPRGIPTPVVRHVDVSRRELPFDVELVEAAAGKPLLAGPSVDGVRALGGLAARVHALPCRGFGPLDPGCLGAEEGPAGLHATWRDYVLLRLDPHVDACRGAGALTAEEARSVRAAFQQSDPILAGAPSRLLHGDLGNHNVFVRAGRVSALIDWEDSLAGDPVFDIASWGTFVGNHERRAAFLSGYCAEGEQPADFELRYWLYFLRIMLAKTVHRQRFGYARTDRIEPGARLRPALAAVRAQLGKGD